MLQNRFARHRLDEERIDTALKTIFTLLQSQELVSFAYLHGSVLDFQSGEQSVLPHDIDVAIYLTEGDWVSVELELQTEFYRRTGLSPEVFDVHALNSAPITAAMEIIRRGKLLFCRDPLQHADFLECVSNSCRRLAGILEVAHA
jgi:predicted nucleotidyltransferase